MGIVKLFFVKMKTVAFSALFLGGIAMILGSGGGGISTATLESLKEGNQEKLSTASMGHSTSPAEKHLPNFDKFPLKIAASSWINLPDEMKDLLKNYFYLRGDYPKAELLVDISTNHKMHSKSESAGGNDIQSIHLLDINFDGSIRLAVSNWQYNEILMDVETSREVATGSFKYTTSTKVRMDTNKAMSDTQRSEEAGLQRLHNNLVADLVAKLDEQRSQLNKFHNDYVKWSSQ